MNLSRDAPGFQLKCCDSNVKAEPDYSRFNQGPGGRLRKLVYTCRLDVTRFEKRGKTPEKIRKSWWRMYIFLQTSFALPCLNKTDMSGAAEICSSLLSLEMKPGKDRSLLGKQHLRVTFASTSRLTSAATERSGVTSGFSDSGKPVSQSSAAQPP